MSDTTESASSHFLTDGAMPQFVTDKLGRRLTLQRLSSLQKMRLFKACGPVNSANQPYLGMAVLAAMVTRIDDAPVPFPRNEAQVEALVDRLGDDGLNAVGEMVEQTVETAEEVIAQAKN